MLARPGDAPFVGLATVSGVGRDGLGQQPLVRAPERLSRFLAERVR